MKNIIYLSDDTVQQWYCLL